MKGFPLALFTSCQTLKIQPLYFGDPCTTLRGPGTGPGVWAPAQGSVPGLVAPAYVKHYHFTHIGTYGRIMYHFYHISHVLAYWAVIGCIAAGGLPDMISLQWHRALQAHMRLTNTAICHCVKQVFT